MPGSRDFTSNLHELTHSICVITSGSCLETQAISNSFGLEVEATVDLVHGVKS